MAASPKVYSTFSVSSGRLCFGSLHNIWYGASLDNASVVQGLPHVRPRLGGTVIGHRIEYSISAKNGTWNAFQLVEGQTDTPEAWFLAHSDVDPEKEIDKILRVAGSPYEADSGSTMNNDKTESEGVFVINRYDWTYYDRRSWDEIGGGVHKDDNDIDFQPNSVGVVDLAEAKTKVLEWREQRSSRREWSKGAVWLCIPYGEYLFGRFGFDDEHDEARSFLFFSGTTEFTRTSFAGLQQTLRKEETPEESFERRLREGYDFSGLEEIHRLTQPPVPEDPSLKPCATPPPPGNECLGPYDKKEHVLRAQDLEALRAYLLQLDRPIGGFVEPWREPLFDLVNEMFLTYLERIVAPSMGNKPVSAAAGFLFPNFRQTTPRKHLDVDCHHYFTHPSADPIPSFDAAYVGGRIRTFLESRSMGISVAFDDDCIAGICRVLAYMFTDILEMAHNTSRTCYRTKIVPYDIRISVLLERELRDLLQFSKVYWKGRDCSVPLERSEE